MSKIGVSLKINVSQIDKARLFRGQKGTYLDATVFIDVDQLDQYGNSGMITQDVSKEEKQQNINGNILGNCKVFWSDQGQQQPQQNYQQQQPQQPNQQQQPNQGASGPDYPQHQPNQGQQQGADKSFGEDIPW